MKDDPKKDQKLSPLPIGEKKLPKAKDDRVYLMTIDNPSPQEIMSEMKKLKGFQTELNKKDTSFDRAMQIFDGIVNHHSIHYYQWSNILKDILISACKVMIKQANNDDKAEDAYNAVRRCEQKIEEKPEKAGF